MTQSLQEAVALVDVLLDKKMDTTYLHVRLLRLRALLGDILEEEKVNQESVCEVL